MSLSLDLTPKKVTDFKTIRTVVETQIKTFDDGSVDAKIVNTYAYQLGKKTARMKEKREKVKIEIEDEGEM